MGAPSARSPSPGRQRSTGAPATATATTPSSAARKDPSADQQLMVALRIRPINEAELEEGAAIIAHRLGDQMVILMDPTEDPDDVLRANRSREKMFIFDMVFGHRATQEEVYASTTKNLIEGVISGYNATVFAYGPTGAGKTYTMLGTGADPGIYIRMLNDLFRAIEATSGDMNYSVCMSYLEIYNEVIRDLLNPSSGFLELREDSKGSIQIAGITEVSTTNAPEIMHLLTKGNKERTQEPTAANKTSSRSHAVLQVTVKQTSRVKDINEEVRVGRLFMVDLAGSERAAQTQNRGKRMKEGAHINRSLLALGNCINALSEKGSSRAQYVNFRDSKLTRLLKDSLGGNSRTVMIAHISPASTYFEESRTTLIYAYRAKNIKTRVKRNLLNVSYHIAQYTSIISDLRREIECLKAKIENQEKEKECLSSGAKDIQGRAETHQDAEEYGRQEMSRLRKQLIGAFKEQMDMRHSLMELENTNMELHVDTSRHLLTIADWEREKAHQASKYPSKQAVGEKEEEAMEEAEREDSPEPHEVVLAREEIHMLLAEQRKTAALKAELERRLATAKKKASQMEKLVPRQATSEDQREVLRLLCKAHELEVGNTSLQAKALYRGNLLCQKDFVIQRHQQHRGLCKEIIQQQWTLIRDHNIPVPIPLGKLYHLYFREEGSLDRQLLLHSLMSNAHQDGAVLDNVHQLEPNKEENQKGSLDPKKDVFGGSKFELPPIIVESDSDRSCKNTPARRKETCDWNPSPTLLDLLRTPIRQQKVPGIPSRATSSKLRSPSSRDSRRKKSNADVPGSPLNREALKEIANSTKRIALIAARRRSRAQDRELSSERSSVHCFEEERLELKSPLPSLSPDHGSKDTESVGSCGAELLRKEPASEAKHRTPSSHPEPAPESQLPKIKLPDVLMNNPTHVLPAVMKIKFPVGHQTD
ncbi:kinesin-like protein KIF19 [Hemicordylus capensis]|uniref:kinesin-like protein KIF19 n=1 Tax=Hemicordylus capensis TaxID=884348 RepID=UPI002302E931|nr:kinesin-like protein KIF19 [Hemicordylus capensis]